jgi:hypothetical protein
VKSCDQVVETSSQARETLDDIARTTFLDHVVQGNRVSDPLLPSRARIHSPDSVQDVE